MANTHIHEHIQSILVPKGHFKTELEARKHVKEMGYRTDVKPVHITDNYYRYRQFMPRPQDHYRTVNLDGVRAIVEIENGKNRIITHDPHHQLRNPKLHDHIIKKKASLHNHQKNQGANIKPEEKSYWQSAKDSMKHTGSEYLKHKALDLAVEHGVKPIAKKVGQELLYQSIHPFLQYI